MTFLMNPEFDRQGWAVCLLWLQGGKQDEAPTNRKTSDLEPVEEDNWAPLFKKEVGTSGPTKLTAK